MDGANSATGLGSTALKAAEGSAVECAVRFEPACANMGK